MCTSKSWKKSTPTVRWQSTYTKKATRSTVRQGDTTSPKLFTAALENIVERLTRETRGLTIDGKYLSHLRFADDILICANTLRELQQMRTGTRWWKWKSGAEDEYVEDKGGGGKWHTNTCQQHSDRERWKRHLFGTEIQHHRQKPRRGDLKKNHDRADNSRQAPRHFHGYIATCLKRQVYTSCVFPTTTYGPETWILTSQAKNKLASAQRNMERSMLNIIYRDRKTNLGRVHQQNTR